MLDYEQKQIERERELSKPEWIVDVTSYKDLGEAIASYNMAIGNFDFFGSAEMKCDDDGYVKLVIELFHDPHPPCNGYSKFCGRKGCPKCKGVPF